MGASISWMDGRGRPIQDLRRVDRGTKRELFDTTGSVLTLLNRDLLGWERPAPRLYIVSLSPTYICGGFSFPCTSISISSIDFCTIWSMVGGYIVWCEHCLLFRDNPPPQSWSQGVQGTQMSPPRQPVIEFWKWLCRFCFPISILLHLSFTKFANFGLPRTYAQPLIRCVLVWNLQFSLKSLPLLQFMKWSCEI